MKKIIVAAAIAVALAPMAQAQERVGDAALGALSGAVVLGPVGAVAGAVVGYSAGPSIARSWGLHGSASRHHDRSAPRAAPADKGVSKPAVGGRGLAQGPDVDSPAQAAAPSPGGLSGRTTSALPPVQSFD